MPTWPASLPQSPEIGVSGGPQDARASFQTEIGEPIRRSRLTKVPKVFTMTVTLTEAQLVTFEAFVETDLRNGAIPFDWKSPFNDTDVQYVFHGSDRLYTVAGLSDRHRRVTMQLMLLP